MRTQTLTVEEAVEIVKAGRVKEERDGSIWVDGRISDLAARVSPGARPFQ